MLRAASARVARSFRTGRQGRIAPVESLEKRTLLSAGDLDLSFGGDGRVTTDVPGATFDRGRPIALQSDGKILQAGWYQVAGPGGDLNFSVVRFTPQGLVDTTFGNNGRVVIDFDGRGDIVNAMAVAPDGKIVLAGSSSFPYTDPLAPDTDVAVARLNPDGSLDTTFDGDGKARINYGTVPAGTTTSSDFAWNMTLDAAGKIILAGNSNVISPSTFALSRLNLDGSLDTTFGGGDGIAVVPLAPAEGGAAIGATAYAVTTDADGRIVAAGSGGTVANNAGFVVARYNPDGTLDPGFDADGFTLTQVRTSGDFAGGVAVAPDGKIIAGGYTTGVTGSTTDVAAARYNTDGSIDTAFGGAGTGIAILVSGGRSEYAFNMRLDAQGRPTFAGRSQLTPSDTYAIAARFTADGLVDFDFGGNGIVQLPQMDDAYSLAVAPAGGDIFVGGVSTPDDGGFDELSVARMDSNGFLFLGFGEDGDGVARADVGGPGWNLGNAVAVQPDGKTIVAGSNLSSAATDRDIVLVRYNLDGSLDATFGTAGRVVFDVSGDLDNVTEIALDESGRIVGAGWATRRNASNQSIEEMLVFRLNPDGSRDLGFGFGGFTVVPNFDGLANTLSEAFDLVLLPDGRIAAAGDWASAPTSATFMMAVAVFDANGFLDPSFNGDGMLRVDATNSILNGRASFGAAIAAYPDGGGYDLIVGGYARASSTADDLAALVRLNLTGPTFDTGFDLDGKLTSAFGNFDSYLEDLAVDPAGRIVAAGYVVQSNPNGSDMAVARFLPGGALDNAFDGDGRVITDFVGRRDQGNTLLLAPDGSIFVAGFADVTTATTSTLSFRDFAVAKYTPAGALDTSFGGDGKVTTDFAGDTDSVSDLALTPDGKLVAAGTATDRTAGGRIGTGQDLAAARYLLVDVNTPPAVSAGADAIARRGMAFARTGQFTDPDADTWTATVDYGDGAGPQPLALGPDKSFTLDKVYAANGTYTVTVAVTDDDGGVGTDTFVVTVVAATRLGRQDVFYNRSGFDGGNPAITAEDFSSAVALGKRPLLPGETATFANYTSFVRGINGIMVYLDGHAAPAAEDFAFRVKDPAAPGGWAAAPAPLEYYTAQNAGAPGAVAAFTFPDGSVRNTWLEVSVLANERTGLLSPQTFYWGNLVGDTGNNAAGAATAVVNVLDQLRTRARPPGATASVMDVADFNRDGRVNVLDTAISRSMNGRSLELMTTPIPAAPAGVFADGATIGRGFVPNRRRPLLEL